MLSASRNLISVCNIQLGETVTFEATYKFEQQPFLLTGKKTAFIYPSFDERLIDGINSETIMYLVT